MRPAKATVSSVCAPREQRERKRLFGRSEVRVWRRDGRSERRGEKKARLCHAETMGHKLTEITKPVFEPHPEMTTFYWL